MKTHYERKLIALCNTKEQASYTDRQATSKSKDTDAFEAGSCPPHNTHLSFCEPDSISAPAPWGTGALMRTATTQKQWSEQAIILNDLRPGSPQFHLLHF
jgi:hypothetical protein